jgi:hypothetical protein
MVNKLMNLITRIDEGMTEHSDVRMVVLIFITSYLIGFAAGYLAGLRR